METSLLWQTFTRLTALERKHLGQWLASPFFCRRAAPLRLYEYLEHALQAGTPPAPDAALERLESADRSTGALRLVMSELLGQIEHFLVYREKFGLPDFKTHLAGAYRKRGLEKHFQQSLREARLALDRLPHRHAEYFEAQVAIEYELYQHLTTGRRTEALNLQALSDRTDTAYLARKLRQVCFALTHQAVYRTEYDFGLLPDLLAYVQRTPALLAVPAIALYYYCHAFLTRPDDEAAFQRFKALLFVHTAELPEAEQRNLHLFAINYCIKKINQREAAYFREAFDLYRSALSGGLLLENGALSPFAYNNIVASALKVHEAAWAERFIHDYAPFLEKKHRTSTFHLNLARVAYGRRQYRDALLHLQQADYKDLINNLIAKTLVLKIHFETDEFDALDAHLQNMQAYLRRQRDIGYHKTNYLNIVRYTRLLMQLPPGDFKERQSLRQRIEEEPELTEQEWLVEMLSRQ
jgi:hypothetical protein